MDPEIETIIKEQWPHLPDEVKRLFGNPSWKDKIVAVGKKNGLDDTQSEIVATETMLVLFGITDPDNYEKQLRIQIQTNNENIKNIVREIETTLFGNVRKTLKKIFQETQLHPLSVADEEVAHLTDMLPQRVKDILDSFDWKKELLEIGNKYDLLPEQLAALEIETGFALIGSEDFEEYKNEIAKNLNLNIEDSTKLASDVREHILSKMIIKDIEGEQDEASFDLSDADIAASIPDASDELSSIKSRLTQPKTIAPTTHEYGIVPEELPKHDQQNAPMKIDPYRELPEK